MRMNTASTFLASLGLRCFDQICEKLLLVQATAERHNQKAVNEKPLYHKRSTGDMLGKDLGFNRNTLLSGFSLFASTVIPRYIILAISLVLLATPRTSGSSS